MIKVIQRFPNFVDTSSKPQEADCESLEDIYNIPYIQRWMDDPLFYRLCKSTLKNNPRHLLVVETNRGRSHWVIAYLEGDIEELSLPEWQK